MIAPATSTATASLTEDQRTTAQRVLLRFFLINGIVVTCVLDNILLLWALQNGMSAAHVAVISTFGMLTMPMMLAGKHISAALGLARAWSLSWFYRYVFVLAMLPAPWMRDTVMAPFVPWLITICVFGLFSMRAMGMVNTLPIIGEITPRDDQGSFQAKVTLRSYIAYFLSMGGLVGLLHWRDTPAIFQVVLLCGSLLGMYSASLLRRLPDLAGSRDAARMGLVKVIRQMLQSVTLRRLTAGWCSTAVATALIVPIAMLAVKRGYAVPDNTALFFTLLELAGSIMAAYSLTVIADHTGPRPILILSTILYGITAGFWAFAPGQFMLPVVGAVFILAGMARGSIHMALNHYLLASTGTRERVGVSMMMQMLSGLTSGLAGMLIAGGLIRYLPAWTAGGTELGLYRTYFRIVLLFAAVAGLTVWRLPQLQSWTVRNVIGLVFSMRDFRTLMTLNALKGDSSDDEDAEQLDRLSSLSSLHSEPVLCDFVIHGRLVQQAHAIRALSRIPFGPATAEALIRLVATGAFTNGWRAAELLGQRRIAAAVPALRKALQSDDPFLRGKSMVALARMRDPGSHDLIREIFSQTDNPRIAIHGAQALELLRTPEDLRRILNKCAECAWPAAVLDEMLMAAAGICGIKTPFFRELRANLHQPDAARRIITTAPPAPALRLAAEHFLQTQDPAKLPEHLLRLLRMCGFLRAE